MIIGIDGTMSQTWDNSKMVRSFVRKILEQNKQAEKYYFIGPGMRGEGGQATVNGAWPLVSARLRQSDSASVDLLGFSRGAAYCMYLAKLIADAGLGKRVAHLIMFDSVGRQADFVIPEQVPKTVVKCFHAYRNPAGGSRNYFENVGLYVEDPNFTALKKEMFMASHGGMGGTWYDAKTGERKYKQNELASKLVDVNSSQGANGVRAMSTASIGLTAGLATVSVPAGLTAAAAAHYVRKELPGVAAQQTSDRNQLNIPDGPVMDEKQDHIASDQAGKWMWDQLIDMGVLPGGSSPFVDASPAEGKNFVFGTPYRVP